MKKIAIILAGLILMAASSAWALPTLTLTSGDTRVIVEDGGVGDRDNAVNDSIDYAGVVGDDWRIRIALGLFGIQAGRGVPQMELQSTDMGIINSTPSSLTVRFSALTTGPWSGPGAEVSVHGNSGARNLGSATFDTQVNGNSMDYLSFPDIWSFGATTAFAFPEGLDRTYDQIDMIATINHRTAGYTTGFTYRVSPVPEPGTMLLLGIGFLGLAIYSKRRMNA